MDAAAKACQVMHSTCFRACWRGRELFRITPVSCKIRPTIRYGIVSLLRIRRIRILGAKTPLFRVHEKGKNCPSQDCKVPIICSVRESPYVCIDWSSFFGVFGVFKNTIGQGKNTINQSINQWEHTPGGALLHSPGASSQGGPSWLVPTCFYSFHPLIQKN